MANPVTVKRRLLTRARLLVQRTGFDLVREPFRHDFVFGMRLHGIDTVLDIGANTGQFGLALRRAGFTGGIVSVEPLKEAFEGLLTTSRDDARWTAEHAAVSDEPGVLTMNVAGNSVSSSALPILDRSVAAAPQTRYVGTEDVTATTVDELVARHALDPARTLVKIDVQGLERAVLAGAERTLPLLGGVRLEMSLVPLYDGEALMPEIVDHLAQHGHELWFVEPGFADPTTRRLLQLDGVFFRTSGGDSGR